MTMIAIEFAGDHHASFFVGGNDKKNKNNLIICFLDYIYFIYTISALYPLSFL
jgi:hypothetical protein